MSVYAYIKNGMHVQDKLHYKTYCQYIRWLHNAQFGKSWFFMLLNLYKGNLINKIYNNDLNQSSIINVLFEKKIFKMVKGICIYNMMYKYNNEHICMLEQDIIYKYNSLS